MEARATLRAENSLLRIQRAALQASNDGLSRAWRSVCSERDAYRQRVHDLLFELHQLRETVKTLRRCIAVATEAMDALDRDLREDPAARRESETPEGQYEQTKDC